MSASIVDPAKTPLVIAGQTVPPGTAMTLDIPVSAMATGLPANLSVRALHGAKPGPRIFVSAAIHGDEIIGAPIIQRLLEKLDPANLAGAVLLVPTVNIFGFMTHSRYLPDRRDLNRSFPGGTKGSLAGQLANRFLKEVIGPCSLGIDIHSAAVHRYNLPQIRIAPDQPHLSELALLFGAPVVIESPLRPGSLRDVARKDGVDMLLMETGEALRFDNLSIRCGVNGVLNVMAHLEMIAPHPNPPEFVTPARSRRSLWLRAPRGGISRRVRKSGDLVNKGDVIAVVTDIFGNEGMEIRSPIEGLIIGHATLPVVNQGDAMFHIAELFHFASAEERIDQLTENLLSDRLLDEDELI
ncbi:MAG: succinylglutamate desuccinylase/aspartoacylase family protein [Blastomonas sp.]